MPMEQRIAMICGRRMTMRARGMSQTIKRSVPDGGLMRTVVEKLMALADNEGVEGKDRVGALRELAQIAKFGMQIEHDSLKQMTHSATEIARTRMRVSPDEGTGNTSIDDLLGGG
jgi:hypothetical protein